jgi:hypothetical protein
MPGMRYVREEIVHTPAERVWQLLVNVEDWPTWTESMGEIKRLDDGPLAVGSRSRVTQPKGRPTVWTVTELEPTRTFTWVASRPGLAFEAVHRIEEVGDAVRTTGEFIGTGPLAWLAFLLAGSRIRSLVHHPHWCTILTGAPSSLVHHPCVGDRGWIADAPEAPPGYRPARSTAVMSSMSSAESGSCPGRADRRQGFAPMSAEQ